MSGSGIVAAVVVGAMFIFHGLVFIAQPPKALDQMKDKLLSLGQFRLLGVAEVLGGAVLVSQVVIAGPKALLVAATLGVIGVLVPATVLHARANEGPQTGFTAVLAIVSVFVLVSASQI